MNQLEALAFPKIDLPMRILASLPIAIVTTLSLLYLMLQLIATDAVEIDSTPRIKISPFILEERPEPKAKPKELDPPQTPEKQPPVDVFDTADTDFLGNVVVVAPPTPVEVIESEKPALDGNSYLIAEIQVQPRYPHDAIIRNIEGYVDIEFDVSAEGATQNIHVVAAKPEGIFENAALRAVAKWRYRAPMVDGRTVPVFDHRERLRFEID